MSFRLDWRGSELSRNIQNVYNKVGPAVSMYMSTKASEFRSYMQSNRPWTDRTGMAKATLNSQFSSNGDLYRITLSHGVSYGIWLELAHGKNYAIIGPTIRTKGPELLQGIGNIFSRVSV